jgi:hypothetical protein
MECHQCQAQNPDGKRFCGDCGTLLALNDFQDARVRKQIDEVLKEKLKDQKVL